MPSVAAALALALAHLAAASEYAGLRNQGNTCYMNSLLQALHHLPDFRRTVFRMDTDAEAAPGCSVPLELQRLFYQLQHARGRGESSVGTELLTDSFGWGWAEVNEQQDVQEFWHMLHEMLHESAGGEAATQLFEGSTLNYVRCTRANFRSEREERFCDLQMQVAGCRSLLDSFRELVREESLTGENRYNTRQPELGLQDAKRGARFKRLPPILQLQLKRFEYDPVRGGMHKLQQALSFPTTLRLRRFMARGAAAGAPAPVYRLHAVVSHVGDVGSGHYVAYVRYRNKWFKFDDTRVTEVAEEAAVTEQFGGEFAPRGSRSFWGGGAAPSAYMLTYVRLADAQAATDGSLSDELPPELRASFEQQHARSHQRAASGPGGPRLTAGDSNAEDLADLL